MKALQRLPAFLGLQSSTNSAILKFLQIIAQVIEFHKTVEIKN